MKDLAAELDDPTIGLLQDAVYRPIAERLLDAIKDRPREVALDLIVIELRAMHALPLEVEPEDISK